MNKYINKGKYSVINIWKLSPKEKSSCQSVHENYGFYKKLIFFYVRQF